MRGSLLCLTMLATAVTAGGQSYQWAEAPLEAFRRDSEGRWRTDIIQPDGRVVEYVFPLLSDIDPDIRVSVERAGADANVTYRYRLLNRATAAQSIGRAVFQVNQPTTVMHAPPGWTRDAVRGELLLVAPVGATALQGVQPGQGIEFTLEGSVLPGVGEVRLSGDFLDGVTVPDGLSEQQRTELERLVARESLKTTRTVVPVIPAGRGESELTRAIVLSRIILSYRAALHEAEHEYAQQIMAALDEAIRAEASEGEFESALEVARSWAGRPVSDEWHRELSEGMSVCLDALLAGVVPVGAR